MHWKHDSIFVGGSFVPSTSHETLEVLSPATEDVVGMVPLASVDDVDRAVASARVAIDETDWPDRTVEARAGVVGALADALRERTDDLADVLASEVGMPRRGLPAGQLAKADGVFRAFLEMAASWTTEDSRPGGNGRSLRVRRVPVGVVAAVVPWNAPLFIAALKLAPALLTGNAVVLKPSLDAPLYTYILAEAAVAAGIPPGVLNIVNAGDQASAHLVGHPGVDHVSFTGSTAVGRRVAEVCGRDLRRCTLELGGKSAAIVLDDIVLDDAVTRGIVMGAMANNGQVCAAQSRVLVPRTRHDEVVDAIASAVSRLRVGDPFDDDTDLGPLVSAAHRESVEAAIAAGRRDGARVVVGGGRPARPKGWYLEPTVFTGVTPEMALAREEVFGPVATITPYDDEAHAIRLANDSSYGLAGAVWAADPDRGLGVARRLRTGSVSINSPAPLDPFGPFGGFRDSGIGREGGPEGMAAFVEHQTIVLPC